MADLATLKQRLTEVETAIHKLMVGGREVRVKVGEADVTYSEASLDKLQAYKASLEQEIAQAEGGLGRQIMEVAL